MNSITDQTLLSPKGAAVTSTVEVRRQGASLDVRLLGSMAVRRDNIDMVLPASRKVRGLLAYLLLSPRPVTRSHLCELLWDVPNDPRGELRWCLSKIRGLIDRPDLRRIESQADTVKLDLSDCFVDAIEIAGAIGNVETLDLQRVRTLSALLTGDFLDGLDIERSPVFSTWLAAQRRRFRGFHATLLERIVQAVPDDEALGYLGQWLELAPFDEGVHTLLFNVLARHGRMREGDEHLAATIRLFESEGLDSTPLRTAWRSARADRDSSTRVAAALTQAPALEPEAVATAAPRRASIAVMPFVDRSAVTVARGGAADGLAFDVITRLAKLRSMFVIAQGTVFALHERNVSPEDAGRMLNVDYVVSGSVQRRPNRLVVTVDLAETRTARIVWTEEFNHTNEDAFLVLDEIGNRIVASVANEIEAVERSRAILKPPNSMDAWEAHHRGLWHMYRFNQPDNELAQHFFQMAIRLDPTFSRAHAGVSFTHWQSAFQGWGRRDTEIEQAYAAANQSLMVDDRDPAAHWAMGRALLLRGLKEQSIVELERAIDLSPNFALGHYMIALVQSQSGDPSAAISAADRSCHLSPFDPLLFGPLGAHALALARLGRFEEAAEWGIKAASRPNAHAHIQAIAALCLALAGRLDEARSYLAIIHATAPRYRLEDFFISMQFASDGERLFREGAKRIGMS
jgi:TolB-like protein